MHPQQCDQILLSDTPKGHNEFSPELSLLQAEQSQLFQPAFIAEGVKSSDHLCSLLSVLQQVLAFPAPELEHS